tara:strand:+ start:29 stop:871 length:843 start_codon:yes stop_codon:yes gene_type:complete
MKNIIKIIFRFLGFVVLRNEKNNKILKYEYISKNVLRKIQNTNLTYVRIPELDSNDEQIIQVVFENNLTMASIDRLIETLFSVKHVIKSNIKGDFVECGSWRGGNAIAAQLKMYNLGEARKIYLYDTFVGMTEPNPELDNSIHQEDSVLDFYDSNQEDEYNKWCFASKEEVKSNFTKYGRGLSGVHLIKGDVKETLKIEENLPQEISILRLDTDWYESTLLELEVLYPRLVKGGILLIDDYGYWKGAELAVEEYFSRPYTPNKPFLARSDNYGRVLIKND